MFTHINIYIYIHIELRPSKAKRDYYIIQFNGSMGASRGMRGIHRRNMSSIESGPSF